MRYHFVGIGGSGLSAIARVLMERGEIVSGSDMAESPFLDSLRDMGAQVTVGHAEENVRGADAVVVSSAVKEDNVEIVAARKAGLPVYKRSQFLGPLTARPPPPERSRCSWCARGWIRRSSRAARFPISAAPTRGPEGGSIS
jgi:UDP-N-acetylmuramate-alanine ligase